MTWTRRRFIKTGILVGTGLLLVDAIWFEKFFIEIKEFYLGNSSSEHTDIRLVQVSDLHIQNLSYQLKLLTKKINKISPDLVLITGDVVDDPKKLSVLEKFLGRIDKNIKKVAILGNWEYWGGIGIKNLESLYNRYNCDLLINSSRQYFFRNKSISITGVDDYVGGSADITIACNSFQISDFHVILNHCPEYSDIIQRKLLKDIAVDFILSGHTHGGQVNIFGWVPFKPQGSGNYLKGWYRDSGMNLYVSKRNWHKHFANSVYGRTV